MIEWDIDKLLLCGVRARYHSDELEEARRIARDGDVDWDQFLHQARLHNVAPLVYHTLRDESAILPLWVSEALRTAYYQAARHNALLYEELAAVVRAFDEAQIPIILLKGAALAHGTYGNVALRPMGDLDLLVPSDMMAKAEALLSLRGYLVLDGSDSHLRHMTLRHPHSSSGTHVEVHRHVVSSPYYRRAIPEEWLWRDPGALVVDGLPALTLSPEATIIHSCLHFLDHTGTKGTLLWLCDVAEVARKKDVDWDALARAVREYRITLPVRSLLLTCRETLGVSPPDHVLDRLLAAHPGFVEKKAYQFCLSGSRSTASKTLFDFLASQGLGARARLLSARLFPPRAYIVARYRVRSPALLPFYYLRMILGAALDGVRALHPANHR